jgi:hypothetical protein
VSGSGGGASATGAWEESGGGGTSGAGGQDKLQLQAILVEARCPDEKDREKCVAVGISSGRTGRRRRGGGRTGGRLRHLAKILSAWHTGMGTARHDEWLDSFAWEATGNR